MCAKRAETRINMLLSGPNLATKAVAREEGRDLPKTRTRTGED